MKFFNIDVHASVIADIQHIFKNLGHQVDDWSLSGHHWVMDKPQAQIILKDGSKLEGCFWVDKNLQDLFYETFKDELDKYDGFISCYPVEYCLLYEKWNKPMIIVNCVRYEHPFTRMPERWQFLDEGLERYRQKGLLHFVCNNKGDLNYIKYFCPKITPTWIPNLCEYVEQKYIGTFPKFIVYNRSHVEGLPTQQLVRMPHKYSWTQFYQCAGVIHVPYHNGSMSIFEHYTANMPMFLPSKEFGKQLFHRGKMFQDLTFYKIYNLPEPQEPENPNNLTHNLDMWFDTCDFYDPENMPHCIYFDSWDHLAQLLKTVNLVDVSNKMKEYNVKRREFVYGEWSKILKEIDQ